MSESIFLSKCLDDVVAEYTSAASAEEDYHKAKWGSDDSMRNRFRLALESVIWSDVRSWLDVGCSVGALFTLADDLGCRVERRVGLDVTPALIGQARDRKFATPAEFIAGDITTAPLPERSFDLVTLIGVLQQCGRAPNEVIAACVRLLTPNGQLFLTTKNAGWKAFEDGTFRPEPTHSWFAYDEISRAIETTGLTIEAHGGFMPAEFRRTALADAHTFFLHARLA